MKVNKTNLKVGDTVMVIAGGSGEKRANKGRTGKISAFVGKNKDRVIVEGVNYVSKHKRQTSMQDKATIIQIEAPIHISNVMYYVDKIAKPVRLKIKFLEDGKKVRGYINPEGKKGEQEFVQV